MNARIIIIPFLLVAALLLYQMLAVGDDTYSIWLIPTGAVIAVYFVFRQQIDAWWYKKYPLPFDQKIDVAIQRFVPAYRTLNEDDKTLFQDRLDQFVRRKVFIGQNIPDLPDDIKYLLCAFPVLMTIHLEDFELEDYDRMVFYKHPFLTPSEPEEVHVFEVEHQDGVLIFSIEQLIPGLQDVKHFYNIGLHAYADVMLRYYPVELDKTQDEIWKDIEFVGFVKKDRLIKYLGVDSIDARAVLIHYYVSYVDRFEKLMPDYFEKLKVVFPLKTISKETASN